MLMSELVDLAWAHVWKWQWIENTQQWSKWVWWWCSMESSCFILFSANLFAHLSFADIADTSKPVRKGIVRWDWIGLGELIETWSPYIHTSTIRKPYSSKICMDNFFKPNQWQTVKSSQVEMLEFDEVPASTQLPVKQGSYIKSLFQFMGN